MRVDRRLAPVHVARFLFYRVLVRVFHAGTRYECPCCGRTFRSFRNFRSRRNVRCPACGSVERQRSTWLYLRDETNLASGFPCSLLHIAPELCLRRVFSRLTYLDYVAGDIDPAGPGSVRLDVRDLPYPDGRFDYVVCSHVLEHVVEDRLAMSELARVLNPDGCAILLVPVDESRAETYEDFSITSPAARKAAFGQDDHVRIYGRDYVERLRSAGFDVQPTRYAAELPRSARDRFRLDAEETLYVARKAAPS